jgi:aspartyl-tRNA(Asn)/glutamyl-tRNA(Gln) amidotransferase subunit C
MIPYKTFLHPVLCTAKPLFFGLLHFMQLTSEQVQRIARLARLEISEAEAAASSAQLNGIFDLIARMQAIDTTGIEPMAHAQDVSQRLRADVVSETDRRAAYQAVAPETEAGLYLVPKVIE